MQWSLLRPLTGSFAMEHCYHTLGASLTIELSASVPCPNPVIADMPADMPKMMLRDPKATFGLIGV